jgi:formylglycine-generating enzyme
MRGALLLAALVSLAGCGAILGIEELGGDGGVDGSVPIEGGMDATSQGDSSIPLDSGSLDGHALDSGVADASEASAAPDAEAGCTPGTVQCFGNSVQACVSGQWSAPVDCSAPKGFCVNGSCSESPASCLDAGPGLSNCGPTQESCCTSLIVDGGTFLRSYDAVTYTDAGSPATVSAFRLDKYEVTVGRFRQFVDAVDNGWLPPQGSGKHTQLNAGKGLNITSGGYEQGWQTTDNGQLPNQLAVWTSNSGFSTPEGLLCDATYETWTQSPAGNENLPINCESWFEAYAFCIWDGGFLPSAAEWNFAAAGGGGSTGQRVYAWSVPSTNTAIDCMHANYDPSAACVAGGANAVGSESPAGNGAFGQADLTGNVWEWNLDAWADYVTPCVDCAFVTLGAVPLRFLRGGARDANAAGVLVSATFGWDPGLSESTFGVRCARAP